MALGYGVDDLHGTIMEERIFQMAGAKTGKGQTVAALEKPSARLGATPMQRDSHYNRIASTARSAAIPTNTEMVPASV